MDPGRRAWAGSGRYGTRRRGSCRRSARPPGVARPRELFRDAALLPRAALAGLEGRLPDGAAEAERSKITAAAAAEHLHFAWAGATEPRQPHYYRIQGPRLLAEYDNTQRGGNHVHLVWRDPSGDFGRDVLAAHYAASH